MQRITYALSLKQKIIKKIIFTVIEKRRALSILYTNLNNIFKDKLQSMVTVPSAHVLLLFTRTCKKLPKETPPEVCSSFIFGLASLPAMHSAFVLSLLTKERSKHII